MSAPTSGVRLTTPFGASRRISVDHMPHRLCLIAILIITASCTESPQDRAVAACTDHLAQSAVTVAIGSEGVQSICECTVSRVYEELPEAYSKVDEWLATVNEKLEKRGLLGVLADTAWFAQRSNELNSFGATFGPALAYCSLEAVKKSRAARGIAPAPTHKTKSENSVNLHWSVS